MLTVRLDSDTESYLEEILARQEYKSKSELIKQLIRDRWLSLQTGRTFLERRGGPPTHLLSGPENLSERATRKQKVSEAVEERYGRRQRKE